MKETKIKTVFDKYGFALTSQQIQQFLSYYEMLVETNKVMNLTAITEFDEVVMKHFLDSVMVTKYVSWTGMEHIIDVGTGAGFPGIPLKILFPELKVTLLDSLNKRVKFLNQVVDELGLQNCQAIHGRAEDIARLPEHREQYDVCVSRAVAGLYSFSESRRTFCGIQIFKGEGRITCSKECDEAFKM
jgi:16S rRNA (guanine527-N7)-methyltransferase